MAVPYNEHKADIYPPPQHPLHASDWHVWDKLKYYSGDVTNTTNALSSVLIK